LNASTGAYIWSYKTEGVVGSSPAVVDGLVYVGSRDQNVYSINASSGALIWNYATAGVVDSSPAVFNGRVYVGSYDKNLYCLNASTGTVVWNYPTDGFVYSSPAVAYGSIYFGSTDRRVYCLDASIGTNLWNFSTDSYVFSSPAVADDKTYFSSHGNKVYCVNALSGEFVWSRAIEATGSCAVADGNVYTGSNDGNVYAFGSSGIHNLTITNVTTSKTGGSREIVGQNYTCRIYVSVKNNGDSDEASQILVYANTSQTASLVVAVQHGHSENVSLTWNTTGFATGNYTMWVYVRPVLNEECRADNIVVESVIYIGVPGDVDGNRIVNMLDLYKIALVFGATRGSPNYVANCDIDDNGIINMLDLYIAATHFGQTNP
jgi:outer membrane protein assembly factor BamB